MKMSNFCVLAGMLAGMLAMIVSNTSESNSVKAVFGLCGVAWFLVSAGYWWRGDKPA